MYTFTTEDDLVFLIMERVRCNNSLSRSKTFDDETGTRRLGETKRRLLLLRKVSHSQNFVSDKVSDYSKSTTEK